MPMFVLATGLVASPYYYPAFFLLLVHLVYRRRGRLRYSAVAALAPLAVLLAAGLAFTFANPPLDAEPDKSGRHTNVNAIFFRFGSGHDRTCPHNSAAGEIRPIQECHFGT